MSKEIVKLTVLAFVFASGGCTTLGMKPKPVGVGGTGVALGVRNVTYTSDAAADGLMDVAWGRTTPDPRQVVWAEETRGKQLVYALVAESDLRCDEYLTAVSLDRNATRSGLDIVGLALGAIGGVASPNASANWLSAGSTMAQSSRRSLEDTVFGGREFSLIYTAIWQGREEASAVLLKRADQGDFIDWDWRSILSLARQYDVKCGLNYGLSRLARAVSAPATVPVPVPPTPMVPPPPAPT